MEGGNDRIHGRRPVAPRNPVKDQILKRVVGLDIGGANLKAADANGKAITRPFAVWRTPEKLASEIARLLASFDKPDAIALTMTAELADCYRTKREGVDAVLTAVEQSAGPIPVHVWSTLSAPPHASGGRKPPEALSGSFVTPHQARKSPLQVAAANWHALATFIGRLVPDSPALLLDIGTTTTDLIPLTEGVPTPIGRTDRERLQSGELVYSGVKRTPICAVVSQVPYRGRACPVAAELFATTLDIYLALGQLAENPHDTETADGRPATIAAARDRLARCLCCDATEFSTEDMAVMVQAVALAQRRQIARGIDAVLDAQARVPERLLISGGGSFLAEQTVTEHGRLAAAERVRLSDHYGPPIAEAACAFALARLAVERDL
jgi:probable H4MPT-linked C1 transfer pathway protein